MFNSDRTILENFIKEIQADWRKIKEIPITSIPPENDPRFKDYLALCAIAVKSVPDALQFVKPPQNTNEISDDYLNLYLTALNHKLVTANTVKYIPAIDIVSAKNLTKNQFILLEKSASISPLYTIGHTMDAPIGSPLHYDHLYLLGKLINHNSSFFKENLSIYFPNNPGILSAKEVQLYLDVFKKHPGAIKKTKSEKVKRIGIEALGLNHFILADFTIIKSLPSDYKTEAEKFIVEQLKGKVYFIITTADFDGEVKDSYLAYSNHPKRKDKCIRLPPDFDQVKVILEICSLQTDEIKLVFIGHTLSTSTHIAEFDAPKILSCVNLCPNIKEVILLGCKTAVLEKTEEEKKLIAELVAERDLKMEQRRLVPHKLSQVAKYSFCLYQEKILDLPNYEDKIKKIIKGLGFDSGFVLVNGEPIKLFFVHNNKVTPYYINEKQKNKILSFIMGKSSNKVNFPSQKQPQVDLRTKKNHLSARQIEKVLDIIYEVDLTFDHKDKALYKENKKKWLTFRSINVPDIELTKLNMECLLGRVVKLFKERGVRPVIIKAFTGVIFVDTQALRFYAIHSNANIYDKKYDVTFFETGSSNISFEKFVSALEHELENANKQSTSVTKAVRVIFKSEEEELNPNVTPIIMT